MRGRMAVVVSLCVMAGGAPTRAGGQAAAAEPRFEVASVKSSPPPFAPVPGGGLVSVGSFGVHVQPGGRLTAVATLQTLVLTAHELKDFQLEGGPEWLTTDYFDISARAEQETATEAQLHAMLRSLLAERFGLRVHVETRPATVHTLTVARADGRLGFALKPTSPECATTLEERRRTGAKPPSSGRTQPMTPACGLTMMGLTPRSGKATYTMGGQPLSALVERLESELGAPVIDRTGLSGLFDAAIEYEAPERWSRRSSSGPDPNSTDPLPVPLPSALQQQLGLKLEKTTGPLAITIIDAAQRPSPN